MKETFEWDLKGGRKKTVPRTTFPQNQGEGLFPTLLWLENGRLLCAS